MIFLLLVIAAILILYMLASVLVLLILKAIVYKKSKKYERKARKSDITV